LLDEVEAASVATPTVNHHEITCALLDRGISVLVEKPIARTVAEADEMIALAAARGDVLQVGHIERFNPAFVLCNNNSRGQSFLRRIAWASSRRARSTLTW
jgi:predicted dehydrogenase